MKNSLCCFLMLLLLSGCALSSGNNENKGDLKKSPCAMVTIPVVQDLASVPNGDRKRICSCQIRHHAVTSSEYQNG